MFSAFCSCITPTNSLSSPSPPSPPRPSRLSSPPSLALLSFFAPLSRLSVKPFEGRDRRLSCAPSPPSRELRAYNAWGSSRLTRFPNTLPNIPLRLFKLFGSRSILRPIEAKKGYSTLLLHIYICIKRTNKFIELTLELQLVRKSKREKNRFTIHVAR